jgi:hypothetical protein
MKWVSTYTLLFLIISFDECIEYISWCDSVNWQCHEIVAKCGELNQPFLGNFEEDNINGISIGKHYGRLLCEWMFSPK